MVTYERRLEADPSWAMSEGSRHFEEKSAVQQALRKITRRLSELEIPYVVAGGMALFAHGFRRFTEDVDLIVTSEGLRALHRELEGAGYVPPFPGSRNLRDAESGVRIEFLVTGQFPGDGKPKPVAFPPPAAATMEQDGIRYLNLPALAELKLASGMTNPDRVKDLADVQELIKLLRLPLDFAGKLNPYVRAKFAELWSAAQSAPQRFLRIWECEVAMAGGVSWNDLIAASPAATALLRAMRDEGIALEVRGAAGEEKIYLTSTDPALARKYGMHPEAEFLDA